MKVCEPVSIHYRVEPTPSTQRLLHSPFALRLARPVHLETYLRFQTARASAQLLPDLQLPVTTFKCRTQKSLLNALDQRPDIQLIDGQSVLVVRRLYRRLRWLSIPLWLRSATRMKTWRWTIWSRICRKRLDEEGQRRRLSLEANVNHLNPSATQILRPSLQLLWKIRRLLSHCLSRRRPPYGRMGPLPLGGPIKFSGARLCSNLPTD